MATDIRTALREEAERFADRIHDLMISQLASVLGAGRPTGPAPKVARPSPVVRERLSQESIEEALAQVVKLLEKHSNGLRSEEIRANLGMNKKLFQYAANLGKTSDQLTQSGERRLTVYSLPAPRPSKAQEEGRVIRKKKR